MISPISPIPVAATSTTASTPSAQVNMGKAPDDVPHIVGDSAHISISGQQYQHAEAIGFALFAMLLSDPDKKKDETALLIALAISQAALRHLAEISPHITISLENGQAVYSLAGDVAAVSSALSGQMTGNLFTGGAAAMAGGMF